MIANDWGKRIARRSDISMGLVHLTKGNEELCAFEVLMKILKEQRIIGSINQIVDGQQRGFICGSSPVVCFQDVPLHSLSENILFEQQIREDDKTLPVRYTAFGLRFDKRYVFKNGGRPVIYEKTDVAKKFLPQNEFWRIVRLDLEDEKYIVDWTHEREWRVKGDFEFELDKVEVLLSDEKSFGDFYAYCEKEYMLDVLKKVKAIITLKSLVL